MHILTCLFMSSIWFSQRPHKATAEEMTKFHSDEYVRFLRSIRPDNMSDYNKQMQRCKYSIYFEIEVSPMSGFCFTCTDLMQLSSQLMLERIVLYLMVCTSSASFQLVDQLQLQ